MLFGASDSFAGDAIMQITVAFNHFGKGLVQRMPRCRWGFIHVVNNDYTHWLMYAIGGSSHPTIISQGNRFIAPPNHAAKEVRVKVPFVLRRSKAFFIIIILTMVFSKLSNIYVTDEFDVIGDEEGLCAGGCVEELAMEIRRRSDVEWSLLC